MIFWELFISFIQVGLFSIGGGYAAIPLIQSQAVDIHQWLSLSEFTDLITIAEMTPGPIAVNSATFVGLRTAGLAGAITATMACILPSILIVSALAIVYKKYKNLSLLQSVLSTLRPAVVALILCAGLSILQLVLWNQEQISFATVQWTGALLFAGALIVLRKKHWNPILVMICCGVIQTVIGLVFA